MAWGSALWPPARRRGRGEGSVYKRSDGRWAGIVDHGWRAGKRQRRFVYGRTRREAANKLRAALDDRDRGQGVISGRQTVAAWLHHWLAEIVPPRVRPSTLRSYESAVRLHLAPSFERTRLAHLRPVEITRYLNAAMRGGLAAQTVVHHHSILRRALGDAVRHDLIAANPAQQVTPPRVTAMEIHPLTRGQAQHFLAHVAGDRLEALYRLSLELGLRQSEALGLTWPDVDLDAATIRIRRMLTRDAGQYILQPTKTARSQRTLGLTETHVALLRVRRDTQQRERAAAGAIWDAPIEALVFTTETGQPINGQSLTRRLQHELHAAGLPRQRWHDLRHAAATFLAEAGVPLRLAADVLGHADVSTTMKVYQHLPEEAIRDATRRVSQHLQPSD